MIPGLEMSSSEWLSLIKHVKQWAGNLSRGKIQRKTESIKALRSVLVAIRKTERYVTNLSEGLQQKRNIEEEISVLWTNLAFDLEDLKLNKLAKVCRIKGKYWSTRKENGTSAFTKDFLEKAGTRLSDVEKLVNLSIYEVRKQ
jgi:hypothetical protein